MITGLVLADRGGEELAVTLAALVPAVVEGLMGDAVVIARTREPDVATIAETAGATLGLVPPDGDPWRVGAALARREWLLCLQAGDVPGEGWIGAVDRFFVAAIRGGRPLGRFSRQAGSAAFTFINLAERVAGTRGARAGDLVQRNWLLSDRGRVRPVRIGAAIRRDFA